MCSRILWDIGFSMPVHISASRRPAIVIPTLEFQLHQLLRFWTLIVSMARWPAIVIFVVRSLWKMLPSYTIYFTWERLMVEIYVWDGANCNWLGDIYGYWNVTTKALSKLQLQMDNRKYSVWNVDRIWKKQCTPSVKHNGLNDWTALQVHLLDFWIK